MLFLNQDQPEILLRERKTKNPHMRTNRLFISQQKIKLEDPFKPIKVNKFAKCNNSINNIQLIHKNETITTETDKPKENKNNLLLLNRNWISKIEKFVFLFNQKLFKESCNLDQTLANSNQKMKDGKYKLNLDFRKRKDSLFITDPSSISKYKLSNSKGKRLSVIETYYDNDLNYRRTNYSNIRKVSIQSSLPIINKKVLKNKKFFTNKDIMKLKFNK